ncbi:ATP-binding cassette domain-containing protein [Sulfidibacter corallicola]|uniref:ATP-binding cassette domain-containing protein n=1 Tax=Sulfidibacter corallicola TaxID=2818388 RepID=A0A8A4TVZ2_SULCO|nr:ATP-binding cassette domain-containing protein [Sulfidibacter corallicola]QTD53142.1 ATP-binding cassette domain-containing protein [Sulfidibacter corallicola]
MTRVCPECMHRNPPQARFCEACGGELASTDAEKARGRLKLPIREVSVGRGEENDLVLDMPMVSTHHVRLTRRQNQATSWWADDLNATNGTALNQPDRRIGHVEVDDRDVLYLGSLPVPIARILRAANPYLSRDFELIQPSGDLVTVGTREDNTISVPSAPGLRPHHAEFHRQDGTWTLHPIGVVKGVATEIYRNGRPVDQPVGLSHGDLIYCGGMAIWLDTEGFFTVRSWQRISLEAREISVVVHGRDPKRRKLLLDDISLTLYPGELCGLMGLAGAGKTTLLRTLNGHRPPSSGRVLINGQDLYQHFSRFRTSLGYVPQEDIFHKDLTVEQALRFAAEMRIAPTPSRKEVSDLIDRVLVKLGLFSANAQIRSTRISNISGGQRRRLNLAIELLTDPALFFLDEPTSGLSSEDALVVVDLLRKMAHEGKTILLTIHQPSAELYAALDNVVYLHQGGRLAFYGPAVPDSIMFTNPDKAPAEAVIPELVLRELGKESPEEWQQRYRDSAFAEEMIRNRRKTLQRLPVPPPPKPSQTVSGLRQGWVVLRRSLRAKLQDFGNAAILLAQAPIIAILIALVFSPDNPGESYRDAANVHFLMVVAAIWFGCSNSARDICGEWAIFSRERMFNLKCSPYILAKWIVGGLISLIQCGVLTAVVTNATYVKAPGALIFVFLWLTAMTGNSLGLLISAVASPFKKNNEIAIGLVPIVLLPMVILGGLIQPYKEMNAAVRVIADTMPTRWCLEAVLQLEAERTSGEVSEETDWGEVRMKRREFILAPFFVEPEDADPWPLIFNELWMSLILLTLTWLYLIRRPSG